MVSWHGSVVRGECHHKGRVWPRKAVYFRAVAMSESERKGTRNKTSFQGTPQ